MGSGLFFLLHKLIKQYLSKQQRLRRNYNRELLVTSEGMDNKKTISFSLPFFSQTSAQYSVYFTLSELQTLIPFFLYLGIRFLILDVYKDVCTCVCVCVYVKICILTTIFFNNSP